MFDCFHVDPTPGRPLITKKQQSTTTPVLGRAERKESQGKTKTKQENTTISSENTYINKINAA